MVAEALPKPASIWSRRRRLQEEWRRSSRKRRLRRGSERLGPRCFSQGGGPPDQEREVSGIHSRWESKRKLRRERSWGATCKEAKGQGRRKGRKEQRSALHSRPSRGAWLLPALASIIAEPDALRAVHNICCFGPPHWKEQCWAGFLPGLVCTREMVLLQGVAARFSRPLATKAATQAAATYPPQLCEECAKLWLDAIQAATQS